MFSWIEQERALSAAALTVRAQARAANDLGKFYHPIFFPRTDANSTKITTLTTADFRPTADRREWNTRGRLIPVRAPARKDIEMLPIESYSALDEQEMGNLLAGALGNQAIFRQAIGVDIPSRIDGLVSANMRRLEYDAMRAWALGQVTVRNPQGSGADVVFDFGFDTNRYVAPAAWTGGSGGTAYAQLVAETYNARDLMGGVRGVVLRQSTMTAIAASSPTAAGTGQISPVGVGELGRRLQEQFGSEFTFNVVEDTVELFNDGGLTRTSTKLWPANIVAFIPDGTTVGNTHYAPVARAFEIAGANPEAQISVRDMTVVRDISNGGRHLAIECQLNALAVPDEQKLYVVDSGI